MSIHAIRATPVEIVGQQLKTQRWDIYRDGTWAGRWARHEGKIIPIHNGNGPSLKNPATQKEAETAIANLA